jgi:citrate (Re)-synthase
MGKLLFEKKKFFPLQDVDEPVLYRDLFPYSEVPRVLFDSEAPALNPAKEIWITDTTFRDGQQARPPYTADQIVDLYKFLHRLGGPNGVIRQSEFFLYSKRDVEAVGKCLALGYDYPEVTGWIRANKEDLKLVKQMKLRETGILTSASDYHIFLKLKKTRRQVMDEYLEVVDAALDLGIRPRCHLEDVTRADIYGFCIPFAIELMKRYRKSGIPVKIRLCDTLGFGVSYPNAILPRSVPKLIDAFIKDAGVPFRFLEWHGHNDFYHVHTNAAAAWLYGCASVNASLLGIGERTGNPPVEAAIMEYIALKGYNDDIDTTVISEIAEYFRGEIGHSIPANQPFVGEDFNVTRAGIHADGLLKDEEIYNIFDTAAILNRPIGIGITDKSGAAGIAHWVNSYLKLEPRSRLDKRHPGIAKITEWVKAQYEDGRVTAISNEEILEEAVRAMPEYFDIDTEFIQKTARRLMSDTIERLMENEDIKSMNRARQEKVLESIFKENRFVQLAVIANKEGNKNTDIFMRSGRISPEDEQKLDKNYAKRAWFIVPYENGHVHITSLFQSKISGLLGVTVSAPIVKDNEIVGVIRLDCKYEDLMKASREEIDIEY